MGNQGFLGERSESPRCPRSSGRPRQGRQPGKIVGSSYEEPLGTRAVAPRNEAKEGCSIKARAAYFFLKKILRESQGARIKKDAKKEEAFLPLNNLKTLVAKARAALFFFKIIIIKHRNIEKRATSWRGP